LLVALFAPNEHPALGESLKATVGRSVSHGKPLFPLHKSLEELMPCELMPPVDEEVKRCGEQFLLVAGEGFAAIFPSHIADYIRTV
jgi:hypothetical protein